MTVQTRDYREEQFLHEQLCEVEKLIAALTSAQLSVASGATSYSLDDGQTRQTVTKASVGELRNAKDAAYHERDMLLARLNGAGFVGRPGS